MTYSRNLSPVTHQTGGGWHSPRRHHQQIRFIGAEVGPTRLVARASPSDDTTRHRCRAAWPVGSVRWPATPGGRTRMPMSGSRSRRASRLA